MLPRVRVSLRVAAIALFTVPASTSYSQVYHASLEELAKTSTAIVVGTTTGMRSFWNEDRSRIYTEVTLRVEENVAGNVGEETVITVPGGRVGNTMYEVSDMPVFLEDEEVVVFLWQDASGRQLVTGGAQGRIGVDTDEQLNRKVIREAPPTERIAPSARTSQAAGARAADADALEPGAPEQVVLLDQFISRIRQLRDN